MYTFILALLLSLHLFSPAGGKGESWGRIHTFAFLLKPHPTQGSNCCSPSYIWNPVYSPLIYLVLLSKSGVVEKKIPTSIFSFPRKAVLLVLFCLIQNWLMQFPSALTNQDPQQRRKQSQREKRKGQPLSGDLWSSHLSRGSWTVLS